MCQENETQSDALDENSKSKVRRKYLQALRELRAEVQDLRDLLLRVKEGAVAAKDNTEYFQKTYKDIQKLTKELEEMNRERRSDTFRRISNSWEKMQANRLLKNPAQDRKPEEQLHDLASLDEEARKIILYVGQYTIPQRLNRWIAESRPGHYLPFHLLFEDEIPTLADRAKVLNSISWAPNQIKDGLIYPGSGLVYRYESDSNKRVWSLVQLLVVLGMMTAFVWEVCYIGEQMDISGWIFKPENAPTLVIGWIALLAGVVIHIGVEAIKRSQVTGFPPVIAMNDWLLHLSARKGDILLKLAMALFGMFCLIATTDLNKLTTASAFLLGYSLDSFVGLFGTSVEQKAAAQAAALKEQLGIKRAEK